MIKIPTAPVNAACYKRNSKKQGIEVNDLEILVKKYLNEYTNAYQSEDEWWKERSTWEEALKKAWGSRFRDGKMHPHQYRVAPKLPEGLKVSRDANVQPDRFKDFDQLYSWIKSITSDIIGLGDTTTYDVARRLGVWMDMQPDRVYLHAGAAKGARKLGITGESVLLSAFPSEMQKLGATHAENFLCHNKDELAATITQNAI